MLNVLLTCPTNLNYHAQKDKTPYLYFNEPCFIDAMRRYMLPEESGFLKIYANKKVKK